MRKKIMSFFLICIVLSSVFLYGCSSENAVGGIGESEKIKPSLEDKKVFVSEVVGNLESDFQEAKKKYMNLKMDNIRPYCTEVTTVSDIEYYRMQNYKGITDPIELYEELLALIKLNLGENLKEENFLCDFYSDLRIGDNRYNSFLEYKEALFSGKEKEVSGLAYRDEVGMETHIFAELQRTVGSIIFNKGEIYKAIPMEVKEAAERPGLTTASALCEKVATYHVNHIDSNLDDVYPLKNGEMSIRDSITFVEDYLNHKTGVEISENVKFKVITVDVYKICEEYYCYRYRITREILGLIKACIDSGTIRVNTGLNFDLSEAYILYTDEVDKYTGESGVLEYKAINEMDKILPLSEALRIVSSNIGENSSYEIKNISLGYMDRTEKDGDVVGKMYASWIIECGNLQDSLDTIFYVNVNTGAVTVQY